MASSPVFGIDLGTTNTVVACSLPMGSTEIVDIKNSWSTPSIVAFSGESFTVGNEVDTNPDVSEPSQTIRVVKRLIGVPKNVFDDEKEKYNMLQYEVVQAEESPSSMECSMSAVRVEYRGKKVVFRPEFISALLLGMIRTELVSMYNLKEEKPKVVISVPAYFNIVQRRATEAAGKMAGLEVLRVVNEPTAGAFAYALHESVEEDRYVLVYDFGGGTFDCTTLIRQNVDGCTRMQVIATKGNPILGGEEIDEQIALHFLPQAKQVLRGTPSREC